MNNPKPNIKLRFKPGQEAQKEYEPGTGQPDVSNENIDALSQEDPNGTP